MLQYEVVGMQADASIGIASWGSIFQVTLDGTSYGCQLASDLVVPARVQMYFQEEIPF